jgi:hypothetical protein
MTEDLGRQLEEAFAALRAEDAGRAPSFETTLATAGRRAAGDPGVRILPFERRPFRWAAAGAGLAAAAVLAALLVSGPGGDDAFEAAVTSYSQVMGGSGWRSPTASLLDVPGRSLLGTVPGIGTGVGTPGARGPAPDARGGDG